MTEDQAQQELQKHFTARMVTLVGSGLSVAHGLPSMRALATMLIREMPSVVSTSTRTQWTVIADRLNCNIDLERALSDNEDEVLTEEIRQLVARDIAACEISALQELFTGRTQSPFGRILRNLTFADGRAEIITTNYDRLLEFAAELQGFGVDSTFTGSCYGLVDAQKSRDRLSYFVQGRTGKDPPQRKYVPHIVLYKPHGSLDWFSKDGQPVRCTIGMQAPQLLITPGANKYRLGYDMPFDQHRTSANNAIDRALRYLIIGYGFNDSQLEQHLRSKLRAGHPGLLLTRSLTPNARGILAECPSLTALSKVEENGIEGTMYQHGVESHFIPHRSWWNLESFSLEVLSA